MVAKKSQAGWFDTETSLARVGGLWALFDAFGMTEAATQGFWDRRRAPVAVDSPCGGKVRATAFHRAGVGAVVAVASWAAEPCEVSVDATALALPGAAHFLPTIPHLQCGSEAGAGAVISRRVAPRAGALLVFHAAGARVGDLAGPSPDDVPCAPNPTRKPARRRRPPALTSTSTARRREDRIGEPKVRPGPAKARKKKQQQGLLGLLG